MKLIKPSFSILPQSEGLEGIYKQIELAGRTCYKSEDKITETSAKEFAERMIKLGHGAMLEHGTLYFKIPANIDVAANFLDEIHTWTKCKHIVCSEGNWWAVTTNLRVMVEHFAPEYMEELISEYLCEPTEYHERRVTVKFICDRGVSHEFVRHRVFSFAQESTRYCNYSKDKFGNEVTFILPCWMDDIQLGHHDAGDIINQAYNFLPIECNPGEYEEILFMDVMAKAEFNYNELIKKGWKAQEARAILPNSLKTELVMTGYISDWKHFFELRNAKSAHPQALELASPLHQEFLTRGYL